ncbi:MAG: hypothetical protein AAFX06_19235 [Planctomycetota bacterium]
MSDEASFHRRCIRVSAVAVLLCFIHTVFEFASGEITGMSFLLAFVGSSYVKLWMANYPLGVLQCLIGVTFVVVWFRGATARSRWRLAVAATLVALAMQAVIDTCLIAVRFEPTVRVSGWGQFIPVLITAAIITVFVITVRHRPRKDSPPPSESPVQAPSEPAVPA